MSRHQTETWRCADGWTFRVIRSRSAFRVQLFDAAGERFAQSDPRVRWGPSLTDALMMAAHYRKPDSALGAMRYLFGNEADRFATAQLMEV